MDCDVLESVIKLLSHYKTCSSCSPELLNNILQPSLIAELLCNNRKTQSAISEDISQQLDCQAFSSISNDLKLQCTGTVLPSTELHPPSCCNGNTHSNDVGVTAGNGSLTSVSSPSSPCSDKTHCTLTIDSNSAQNVSTDKDIIPTTCNGHEEPEMSLISISTSSELSDRVSLYSDFSDSLSCFSVGSEDRLPDVSGDDIADTALETTVISNTAVISDTALETTVISNCHDSTATDAASIETDLMESVNESHNSSDSNITDVHENGGSPINNTNADVANNKHPIGRSAIRNAIESMKISVPCKDLTKKVDASSDGFTSNNNSYARSGGRSPVMSHNNNYKAVTTRGVNESMWGKNVSVEGRVTRCFTVPKSQANVCVKLLNLRDDKGISQVTLRGDIAEDADDMKEAGLIVIRGTCYKRQNIKSKIRMFEVVVHSWSPVSRDGSSSRDNSYLNYSADTSRSSISEKENVSNNSTDSSRTRIPRRQSTASTQSSPRSSKPHKGVQPKQSPNRTRHSRETTPEPALRAQKAKKPHSSMRHDAQITTQKLEACYVSEARYVAQKSEPRSSDVGAWSEEAHALKPLETAVLSLTRSISKPPPLVPIENRTSLAAQYSPIAYFDALSSHVGRNIVTWGTLSNVTSSSALLVRNQQKCKLFFPSSFSTKGTLVLVEGSPFYDSNNDIAVAVIHIEDLYYKHVACLKYLASNRDNQVKTVGQLPKVTSGSELGHYHGRTILMRAKLVHITMGQGNNRGYGRVVAGDGVTCHFSFVHCQHKFRKLKIEDQVVLVGKVDYDNEKNSGDDVPWITIEHMQVIPNKEEDSVLGFAKTAIYEVLKQIVLETLKQEEIVELRDPWNFLND